jgi:aryl-alcohol dehydrogenase-like predicted oxidoreductase
MTYEKLIKQGRIKAYGTSEKEIQRLLEIASRDLSTAENTIEIDPD